MPRRVVPIAPESGGDIVEQLQRVNATAALNWTDGVGSKSIAAFAAVECNATTNAASNTATLYSDGAAVTVVVAYSGTGAWYAYAQLIG